MINTAESLAFQGEAVSLFDALEGVKNTPQGDVRGLATADLRTAEAFASRSDFGSMPKDLRDVIADGASGIAIQTLVSKHNEGYAFSLTLMPLPLSEGKNVYVSNNPPRAYTQNLEGQSNEALGEQKELIEGTARWVDSIVRAHI